MLKWVCQTKFNIFSKSTRDSLDSEKDRRKEVLGVYRLQDVRINAKHVEIIIRQMLRKVKIEDPGDSEFLPGNMVDLQSYEEVR